MKESKTTYSYLIEHMQDPSFQKVWDIAFDFVRKLPSELSNELHESLNRGVDVLDSEPLLQMYIYSFGKMHNAKLQYAFEHLHKNAIKYNEVEIVDYGCGQGLATICYHDFMITHNPEQTVKKITLIEPSSMALSRAELLCSKFYPETEIVAINKQFDDLLNNDLSISSKIPTIHFLSNILDVESYDLLHFSQFVKEQSEGSNEYILVSPMQNVQRVQRLKTFASIIEKNTYFEQYLEKRELDSEKDWTCAVLLCTQGEIVEYDCDEVFQEANLIFKDKGKELNEGCYEDIFGKLQACANYGDKRCQNMLGLWYDKGIGTNQNFQLAFEWYKKAAEQEYLSAFGNIGDLYRKGNGVEQNIEKAIEFYNKGVYGNHSGCQYKLGLRYLKGEGVEENPQMAFSLFLKSSSQEYAPAKYQLYRCYKNGWGTKKDEKAALNALEDAVKLKHPQSCYILATHFQTGEYVEKDERKAFRLFKKSAEMGYCSAQEKLGDIYRNGTMGEEESPRKSFNWYLKAAKQNSSSAQFYMGVFYSNGYGVKKDYNTAFEWYVLAGQQNNPSALNNLAICYEYGRGTSIDLGKAISYYEESAKMGNITAQKNLAVCYLNGTGVEINPERVFFWTMEAAKRRDTDSQQEISLYYLKGYGVEKNHDEALVWYAKYYLNGDKENRIKCSNDAYVFFKGKEDDAQSLYVVGKCLQYGVSVEKNVKEAYVFFEKAAKLGHIESIIKVRKIESLYELCSVKNCNGIVKDAYGVEYSADGRILIGGGYQKADVYQIDEGTRVICDNAFINGSFKKIIIPSSVVAIGKNPFVENEWRGCHISEIECHSTNFVVERSALYTRDMKRLISYFGQDTKYSIPDGVEVIGKNAFAGKGDVLEIEFPESLNSIEDSAFDECSGLKFINLPQGVTNIGRNAFYGCVSLTEVKSLGSVSIVNEASFMGCNINSLNFPDTLVEIGDDAFNSNRGLVNVTLPPSVKKIGNSCFAHCNIGYVVLSDSLEEIGDFCFWGCPIENVIIPSFVKKIGINPFIGTKKIKCIGNERFVSENGLLYDAESGGLISHYSEPEIVLQDPIHSVKSFAFYNSNVTGVFMGSNIVEIEPWAFYGAKKLESVFLQNCKVKRIPSGCFAECKKLYKIDIPGNVLELEKGAFFDCYDLKKIYFRGERTKACEDVFRRIERPSGLPNIFYSRHHVMGSSISESYERKLDFESFPKIEIIVPEGCSERFKFAAIYNYDIYNEHSNYGYGMDRTFVVKEDEKE